MGWPTESLLLFPSIHLLVLNTMLKSRQIFLNRHVLKAWKNLWALPGHFSFVDIWISGDNSMDTHFYTMWVAFDQFRLGGSPNTVSQDWDPSPIACGGTSWLPHSRCLRASHTGCCSAVHNCTAPGNFLKSSNLHAAGATIWLPSYVLRRLFHLGRGVTPESLSGFRTTGTGPSIHSNRFPASWAFSSRSASTPPAASTCSFPLHLRTYLLILPKGYGGSWPRRTATSVLERCSPFSLFDLSFSRLLFLPGSFPVCICFLT